MNAATQTRLVIVASRHSGTLRTVSEDFAAGLSSRDWFFVCGEPEMPERPDYATRASEILDRPRQKGERRWPLYVKDLWYRYCHLNRTPRSAAKLRVKIECAADAAGMPVLPFADLVVREQLARLQIMGAKDIQPALAWVFPELTSRGGAR